MNDTEQARFQVRMPMELKNALQRVADQRGQPMAVVLRDAVAEYVERYGEDVERVQLLPRFGREDSDDENE